MSFTYKTLIVNTLKDDATIQGLFGAAATGSARVIMENLYVSASYPQVLVGYSAGETRSNLSADDGQITITIEAKGTGSTHAHQEIGNFRSAILSAIDDTGLAGTAVAYLLRKFSEVEGFDEENKVHWLRMGFNGEFFRNTSFA